ncbi:type II secretion system F family protein, partial [Patescibacteria group bacterium]|nr:type II secretion system F family protein [Patescibacteria group bacterium]
MLFTFKAKSKNGEVFEGEMDSHDRFTLAHEIRSRGNTPISIKEKNAAGADPMIYIMKIFRRVSIAELIIFTKNLSGMLRAGLSLSRALSVLEKQTKNFTLSNVLLSLTADINSGETFSSALAKFPNVFSTLFVSMVRAGEESGNLAGALSDIGLNLEKAHSLTKKIKGALIYPGVILSAMVVIGVLMFAFVVPTLASTFKELGVTLPATTRFIITMGNFFSNNLMLTFFLIISG